MAYVPDNTVIRGIKYMMQSNGKLDNTKPRTKVSTRLANTVDKEFPQLLAQWLELSGTQVTQVCRGFDLIQQGRVWSVLRNFCKHLKERYPLVHRLGRKIKAHILPAERQDE